MEMHKILFIQQNVVILNKILALILVSGVIVLWRNNCSPGFLKAVHGFVCETFGQRCRIGIGVIFILLLFELELKTLRDRLNVAWSRTSLDDVETPPRLHDKALIHLVFFGNRYLWNRSFVHSVPGGAENPRMQRGCQPDAARLCVTPHSCQARTPLACMTHDSNVWAHGQELV